jgi:hypothetical protein
MPLLILSPPFLVFTLPFRCYFIEILVSQWGTDGLTLYIYLKERIQRKGPPDMFGIQQTSQVFSANTIKKEQFIHMHRFCSTFNIRMAELLVSVDDMHLLG